VFIDADHIFDFWYNHGLRKYRQFFALILETDLPRMFVVLHSFEVILVLWICIFVFSLDKYWICAAIGFTQHLILDQLGNPIRPFGYFFIYRLLKGFKKEHVVWVHKLKKR